MPLDNNNPSVKHPFYEKVRAACLDGVQKSVAALESRNQNVNALPCTTNWNPADSFALAAMSLSGCATGVSRCATEVVKQGILSLPIASPKKNKQFGALDTRMRGPIKRGRVSNEDVKKVLTFIPKYVSDHQFIEAGSYPNDYPIHPSLGGDLAFAKIITQNHPEIVNSANSRMQARMNSVMKCKEKVLTGIDQFLTKISKTHRRSKIPTHLKSCKAPSLPDFTHMSSKASESALGVAPSFRNPYSQKSKFSFANKNNFEIPSYSNRSLIPPKTSQRNSLNNNRPLSLSSSNTRNFSLPRIPSYNNRSFKPSNNTQSPSISTRQVAPIGKATLFKTSAQTRVQKRTCNFNMNSTNTFEKTFNNLFNNR